MERRGSENRLTGIQAAVLAGLLAACGSNPTETQKVTAVPSEKPSPTRTLAPTPEVTPTVKPTPEATPIPYKEFMTAVPEVISFQTFSDDLNKSLVESSFLKGTIITHPAAGGQVNAIRLLNSCGNNENLQFRQQDCKALILYFYQAYHESFVSGNQTGTDLLYTVSKDAYMYAIGSKGPYSKKALLDSLLEQAFSQPINIH